MIIWLASYPRSGNSLFASLVKHALGIPLYCIYQGENHLKLYTYLNKDELRVAAQSQDVFFVKTHELPNDNFPAVYLVRDGRDAIVSYAHYIIDNKIKLPIQPPENLFTWALNALVNSPDQFSGWSTHVQAWTTRPARTVLLRYEDLVQHIKQMALLKSTLEMLELTHLCIINDSALPDFSSYHEQSPIFFRKGKAGAWIAEMPPAYHLQFWERHGDMMQKLGYKIIEEQNAATAEFLPSEFSQVLGKKAELISTLAASLDAAYQTNHKLTLKLVKAEKDTEDKARELDAREQIIQNFRYSLPNSLVHGPFRYIPIIAKMYHAWVKLKGMSRFLKPRLGVLRQHSPKPCDLPASYFYVEKIILPAPSVSIVTPTYNYAHFLERTMKSVTYQEYPKLEYIVQDGGSTDDTIEIVEKFLPQLKHFESAEDNGQAHAINLGFQHTSGEIMAFLNADDVLLPDTLAYVANYFSTHSNVDVVYGHRLIIDENDKVIGDWIMPPHDGDVLRWADYIPQETLFWRRRIWEKVGGQVDESFQFAMDWDLLLRFQEAGAVFERLPRFLAAFRVHDQQKTSAQISDFGEKEITRLRLRNFGREVDYWEISRNLRKFLQRSMWEHWMHKLRIKKQKFLAYRHNENEPVLWYESKSVEKINQILLPALNNFSYEKDIPHSVVDQKPITKHAIFLNKDGILSDQTNYEIVPLGLNCDVGHFLREQSVRKFAFPFDWNITPIQSVIELLDNDFEDFLKEDNLIYLPPTPRILFEDNGVNLNISEELITPVICRKYRILFPHDFSAHGMSDFPAVKLKYINRINRLIDLMKSDREVFFVAHNPKLNDWQNDQYLGTFGEFLQNRSSQWKLELSNVLRRKYKTLKFNLLNFTELKELIDLNESKLS